MSALAPRPRIRTEFIPLAPSSLFAWAAWDDNALDAIIETAEPARSQ